MLFTRIRRSVHRAAVLCMVVLVTGCANVSLKQRQTPLTDFSAKVARHLLDTNHQTYAASQKALGGEIVPSTLAELKKRGICAKSPQEIKTRVAGWKKDKLTSAIMIESAEQGYPDDKGLVPVEVKGKLQQSSSKGQGQTPFDIVLTTGVDPKTKNFVVVSVSIK